jgi:hypothetical protein
MKTSELTGAALDWAVAKCEGGHIGVADNNVFFDAHNGDGFTSFGPSTDWSQGGPIIERERFEFRQAKTGMLASYQGGQTWFGPTPLIAAMRCYVTSKLGDEIEIPEELK